jgi:hypothetical protein
LIQSIAKSLLAKKDKAINFFIILRKFMKERLKIILMSFWFVCYSSQALSSQERIYSCQSFLQNLFFEYNKVSKRSVLYIRNYRVISSMKSRLKRVINLLETVEKYDHSIERQKVVANDFLKEISLDVLDKISSVPTFAKTIKNMNVDYKGGFCSTVGLTRPIKDRLLIKDLAKMTEQVILEEYDKRIARVRRVHNHSNKNPESSLRRENDAYSIAKNIPAESQCSDTICGICYSNEIEINYDTKNNYWYARKGIFLPCGHITCKECKIKIRPRKCPWCRESF